MHNLNFDAILGRNFLQEKKSFIQLEEEVLHWKEQNIMENSFQFYTHRVQNKTSPFQFKNYPSSSCTKRQMKSIKLVTYLARTPVNPVDHEKSQIKENYRTLDMLECWSLPRPSK